MKIYTLLSASLFFLFTPTFGQNCNPSTDSLELVSLYNATNGPNWFPGWDLNQAMSTWAGVTLSPNGCVQKLELDYDRLNGVLIDLQLPELEVLNLAGNRLDSILDFSGMPNLEILNLAYCRLKGVLPDFSGLPLLKELHLNSNDLIGQTPDFSAMPLLEELYLDHNDLAGTLPDFQHLRNLKKLGMATCRLQGSIPNFSQLNSIEELVLRGNDLVGSIPNFSNIQTVIILDLSSNDLTGGLVDYDQMPVLEELDFRYNQLSGPLPDFQYLPQLKYLQLTDNQLSGSVADFAHMPRLIQLDLGSNLFSGGLVDFAHLDSLVLLNLRDNQMSGNIPDFSNLPVLQNLTLSFNQFSGPIPDFSNLNSLWFMIIGGNQLNGTIPNFSNLPNLRMLNVDRNPLSGNLPAFSNLPQLNSLDVFACGLEGRLPDLPSLLPNLRNLYVWQNNFTYLPDLSPLTDLRFLYVGGNYFSFDDLIPNQQVASTVYRYKDQKTFEGAQIPFSTGDDIKLHFPIDSFLTSNTYSWYKNGQLFATQDSNSLWMYNLVPADSGYYTCEATNPAYTDLTLLLDTIELVYVEGICGEVTQIQPSKLLKICKDSIPDSTLFTHSGSQSVLGVNYAFVITDTSQAVLQIENQSSFDLNHLALGDYRIYGLSYPDSLALVPGDTLGYAYLSACDSISSNFVELEVYKGEFEATFSVQDTGLTVYLVADSIDRRVGYMWDMGNGDQISGRIASYTYPDYGNYQICLTADNLCATDSICLQVEISPNNTSIAPFASAGISLYPNPAKDYLQIQLPEHMPLLHQQWELTLYDAQGRKFLPDFNIRHNAFILDIADFNRGIYICRISYADKLYVGKWMK